MAAQSSMAAQRLPGYANFYLPHPVSLRETIQTMRRLDNCSAVKNITWMQSPMPSGKQYSPKVAIMLWEGRGGHIFKFEMGAQRETNETNRGSSGNHSRLIGLVFLFMLHPKSAQTASPRATS